MDDTSKFDILFSNFREGVVNQLKLLTDKVEKQTETRHEDREEIFQRITDLREDINSSMGKIQITLATVKKELETSAANRSFVVSGAVSVVVGIIMVLITLSITGGQ